MAQRRRSRRKRAGTVLGVVLALTLIAPPWGFGEDRSPEEYGEEEFPQILQDLRRGEIILAGSFPISLFLALEVFDFYRYAANDWDLRYAPWPLRSASSAPYVSWERTTILVSALSLSAAIALADYIVGKIVERRAQDSPTRGR
ncbi:MAG: hypothetical protein JW820_03015 [Spirochaetales bacterium]|nr:hypothetical protein [Spirochaetales bacterium]